MTKKEYETTKKAYMREWYARHPEARKQNAARAKAWAKAHPERRRATMKRWREADPIRYLFTCAKGRAKRDGTEFTITLADIPPMGTHCPLLGHAFPSADTHDRRFAPSLDRIDPALGYVPGNVWVVGYRANAVKNDGTAEEHEKIAAAMRAALAASRGRLTGAAGRQSRRRSRR